MREIRYSKRSGYIKQHEFVKGANLHDAHGQRLIHSGEGTKILEEFIGVEQELEINGIFGTDFEEDEDDSMIIDNCMIIK